jgi:hypothetical protein
MVTLEVRAAPRIRYTMPGHPLGHAKLDRKPGGVCSFDSLQFWGLFWPPHC